MFQRALVLCVSGGLAFATSSHAAIQLEKIKLPAGFEISVYASGVKGARSLALSPSGTLFVGTREAGNVYAIKDGEIIQIASKLYMPNGVAFRDGSLYVAEG